VEGGHEDEEKFNSAGSGDGQGEKLQLIKKVKTLSGNASWWVRIITTGGVAKNRLQPNDTPPEGRSGASSDKTLPLVSAGGSINRQKCGCFNSGAWGGGKKKSQGRKKWKTEP